MDYPYFLEALSLLYHDNAFSLRWHVDVVAYLIVGHNKNVLHIQNMRSFLFLDDQYLHARFPHVRRAILIETNMKGTSLVK